MSATAQPLQSLSTLTARNVNLKIVRTINMPEGHSKLISAETDKSKIYYFNF